MPDDDFAEATAVFEGVSEETFVSSESDETEVEGLFSGAAEFSESDESSIKAGIIS